MKLLLHNSLVALLTLAGAARAQTVADFSDIALPPESFDNNADGGAFVSRGVAFNNAFTDFGGGFTAYDGFALSTVTDTATPGFGNQYASYAGGGAGGRSGPGVGGDPLRRRLLRRQRHHPAGRQDRRIRAADEHHLRRAVDAQRRPVRQAVRRPDG